MMHFDFSTSTRRIFMAAGIVATLAGCATGPSPSNLADTLARTPSLSTLNALVTKAGLTETFKSSGPFTVFAPSNDAFKGVPAKVMEELSNSPEKLKDVLTYHVIAGKSMANDVKNSNVKTLNGATFSLSKAGEFVTVEGAMVTTADITATNGVVHIVDTVLIPPAKK
jgi:uncharacterized surface protein with fasciclin (FAS1) repeats